MRKGRKGRGEPHVSGGSAGSPRHVGVLGEELGDKVQGGGGWRGFPTQGPAKAGVGAWAPLLLGQRED